MGVVYLAKHTLLGKAFAVKVVRADSADDQVMIERFKREAQAVAGLSHPNTVTVTDFGVTDDGLLFLVMEYLDGVTCAEVLAKTGPLPPERVVHIALQVCDSLHEAHQQSLVHRDIKPNNLLLTRVAELHDVIKVIDFGLAKQTADEPDEGGGQVTRAGLLIGTPQYMPPEQIRGLEPDHRLDIYSFGVTMFRLLTGRHPFESRDVAAMFHMHLSSPPPVPSDNLPDGALVDLDLDDVVLKCLAKDPPDRFASTAELKQALLQCASAGQWSPEQAAEAWEEARGHVHGLDVEALLNKPLPPPIQTHHHTGPVASIPRDTHGPGSGQISPASTAIGSGGMPHSGGTLPPPPPPPPRATPSVATQPGFATGPPTAESDLVSGPISTPSGQTSFAHGEIVGHGSHPTTGMVHVFSWKRMAITAVLALIVAFVGATAAIKMTKGDRPSAKAKPAPSGPAAPLPAPTAAAVATAVPVAPAPAPAPEPPLRPIGAGRDIAVQVSSNPAGATVYEEGDALGETPLVVTRRRAFESVTLALKLKGYRRASRTIDLAAVPGDSHDLVVNLKRIPPSGKSADTERRPRKAEPSDKVRTRPKAKSKDDADSGGKAKAAPWEKKKSTGGDPNKFRTVD